METGHVRGGTTLYGELLEATDERLVIELDSGRVLVCPPLAGDAVRARVGTEVGLEGEATWTVDGEIVEFRPSTLTPFRGGDGFDALGKLGELCAGKLYRIGDDGGAR